MQVRKQQLELDMEQQTSSKSETEYVEAVYCHPAYLYAEYNIRNSGQDEAQDGIKISRRYINNLRYTDDTTLMEESEELKSLSFNESERGE